MKLNEAFPSEYLKAADVNGDGLVVTISGVRTEEMPDGKRRRSLSFQESVKRLLMNKTNFARTAEIAGEEDDELWVGKKIRLVKERVPFKGEMVDAVRVATPDVPF